MELQFEIEALEELRRIAYAELEDIEDRRVEIEGSLEEINCKLRCLYKEQHRQWTEEHKEQVSEYYRSLL